MEEIIKALQNVYDPEFPIVDIYTMGLIYDVKKDGNKINILMTLTSPTCPLGDMIIENIKSEINKTFPQDEINVELTFDPMRKPEMIKDEDLKRMFD